MKYLVGLLLLIAISCDKKQNKEPKTVFVQPEVLIKGAAFDIMQLTFNEDFRKLVSKSLDTINNDYTLTNYESAIYPTQEQIKNIADDKRITHLEEERYYFELLEKDSIAQFHGLFANQVAIETDLDLNIKTFLTYAKVPDTITLDSILRVLYNTYGKTVYMQDYKDEYGLSATPKQQTNEQGENSYFTEYEEKDIDYEAFLYKYKQQTSDNYHQWNLDDRILQIEIGRGFEANINFTSGGLTENYFYTLEILLMSKKEYDLTRNRLISVSTENDFPSSIKKPYYVKALDFYINDQKYINNNKEDVYNSKDYDFNK